MNRGDVALAACMTVGARSIAHGWVGTRHAGGTPGPANHEGDSKGLLIGQDLPSDSVFSGRR